MLGEIMSDYSKGDVKDADKLWKKADPLYKAALKSCTKNGVQGDFRKLTDYEQNTLARKDAKSYISGRMKKFQNFIDKLGKEMVTEWNNGDYRAAGMYDGQIA